MGEVTLGDIKPRDATGDGGQPFPSASSSPLLLLPVTGLEKEEGVKWECEGE